MPSPFPTEFVVHDLGVMEYDQCLDLQCSTHQRVLTDEASPTVLLVEHPPVITVSGREGVTRHILAEPRTLERLGIDVQPTDRGGDVTYHGPGQLVVYPIIRLAPLRLNIGRYMRLLEQIAIETVNAFGVEAHRVKGKTGVWVSDPPSPNTPNPRKLCALGVRVRKNVTLHGLALNVHPNMKHFKTIIPCGLKDHEVVSLRMLLGDRTPSMTQVKTELMSSFLRSLEGIAGSVTS